MKNKKTMKNMSDEDIIKKYQYACVSNIQWLIDNITFEDDLLKIDGWAVVSQGAIDDAKFLINGEEFDQTTYPIQSPDLKEFFWSIDASSQARFSCEKKIPKNFFNDSFACFQFVQDNDETLSIKTAWYLPNPERNHKVPKGDRIQRVIGTSSLNSYLIGGATIFNRISHYLHTQHSKKLADFNTILDWGCGSGRVSRYFSSNGKSELYGVDIDEDNILWCQENLTHGNYSVIPITPPTSLPSNHFDLMVGFSVLTHLDESNQLNWLKELKRISKKGGLLMLSIEGLSQAGLYRPSPDILRNVEKNGFVVVGNNFDLDNSMGENDHYLNVIQSRDYINNIWGELFSIIDIVSAIAANQDLVVMRNDRP